VISISNTWLQHINVTLLLVKCNYIRGSSLILKYDISLELIFQQLHLIIFFFFCQLHTYVAPLYNNPLNKIKSEKQ